MPTSTSRRGAYPAVMVVLALLVGGCAGQDAEPAATPTTTTLAPTTTGPGPMTAEELAWLKTMTTVRKKIDKALTEKNVHLTPSKMLSYANTMRSCRRELLGAGSPSDRLQPVYALVKKACAQYDKGARCFMTAAGIGIPLAGSPEDRAFTRAIDCGFAAQGKGLMPLFDAENKGEAIEAAAG
jgi:hypothetical protein